MLYFLDFSRFIAAIFVLISHFRHFYYVDGLKIDGFVNEVLPYYEYISIPYDYGLYAVQYFWIMSGFVFYLNYFMKIQQGNIDFRTYIYKRFARLYPLHFATLLLVLYLSIMIKYEFGFDFVYQENDIYHFFLQLMLISNWGFEVGDSYNGPIWSVSVEVFSYVLFFIVTLRFGSLGRLHAIIFSLLSVVIYHFTESNLFLCSFLFFFGGVVYNLSCFLCENNLINKPLVRLILLCVVTMFLYLFLFNISSNELIAKLLLYASFGVLVLYFSTCSSRLNVFFKKVSILGNISFSIYLVHFPLQMVISYYLSFEIYNDEIVFWCFIFFSLLIGCLTYVLYEVPARKMLLKIKS